MSDQNQNSTAFLPKVKQVRTKKGQEIDMFLATTGAVTCGHCGERIKAHAGYHTCCTDCGEVFCEPCVIKGRYDEHVCDYT